ncbi:MAG: winged helix-turn-helix domain-containing protein [archaeon]|nr:winged helix-turn-helix domain-containing protein [archaeon]
MFEEIVALKRSKTKTQILKALFQAKTPTEVAKQLNLHQSSVSRSILQMEQAGLLKCVTPKERNFRHYLITEKGKKLLKIVQAKT